VTCVAAGLLIGVDAVELDRVGALAGPGGTDLYDRVAAPGEREVAAEVARSFDRPAAGPAALLAVKEAAVKAAGGRPRGFTWRDVVLDHDQPDVPAEAAAVLGSFEEDGLTAASWSCGVRLTGAWDRAPHPARTGVGAARLGLFEDHLFAVVVLWAGP
jgi:holo-[acyl-carrier protein] synthase